ncbi:MAG: hypothetical protein QGM50_05175 [Anaerolineae bacterium]|nr:hypothetical protein [Anaerolineae bacterium]MDK1118168.1 hypothetical protein [Anaerolineae bacterium]
MRTSLEWKGYYEVNSCSILKLPWEIGQELSQQEQLAIAASVQDFQKGESSEVRHLIRAAKNYADQSGDYEYVQAIRLFIAEEQRHAKNLGRFLEANGITLAERSYSGKVFRASRQAFASLEISISVLITAEIIAKV